MEKIIKGFQSLFEYPIEILSGHPVLQALFWIIVLIIASYIANFVVRQILLRAFYRLLSAFGFGELAGLHSALGYLANIAPAWVIYYGIVAIPHLPKNLVLIVQNVSNAFVTLVIALAISASLDFLESIYNNRRGRTRQRSIKGLVQVIKIIVFVISGILIIATLIDKSPLVLLSGLGALAAVIILISQDTLLSFVAGIQLSATDMVRIGDWITVPSLSADGDVVDISLHSVQVRNFDNTISTVPTRKLVSDSFINWRAMQESGGRRIKRALNIDQTSIHFLTPEEEKDLAQFRALGNYLKRKKQEMEEWNKNINENPNLIASARKLTNIGTFRAYAVAYLENNPLIRKDMTLLVRQLAPTPTGLPLEVYCFSNTVKWADYETIQSDVFDHFYSILPRFGLRVFQEASGNFTELVVKKPLPMMITEPEAPESPKAQKKPEKKAR